MCNCISLGTHHPLCIERKESGIACIIELSAKNSPLCIHYMHVVSPRFLGKGENSMMHVIPDPFLFMQRGRVTRPQLHYNNCFSGVNLNLSRGTGE